MHVGSLHLFEMPAGYRGSFYRAVRRMMESRMVPVLRRRLATLPLQLANPVWLQGEVDLDEHIRCGRVPAPGTWAQLEAVVDALPVPANVLVSNVPGPPVPLHVGGLRMSGYWPLSIVEHGVGVNITLIDYAGTLFFGFVVARNAMPDPRALADDFLAAFAELQQHMQHMQKLPKGRIAPAPAARRKVVAKPAASRGKAARSGAGR